MKLTPSRSPSNYAAVATAANIRFAYEKDLARFFAWGGTIPSTPQRISEYLSGHAATRKLSTLTRWLASIIQAHLLQGLGNPCRAMEVRRTLRGIKKEHGAEQWRVATALRDLVIDLIKQTSATLAGVRNKAVLLGRFRRRAASLRARKAARARRHVRFARDDSRPRKDQSGLRRHNVTHLRWEQVDLDRQHCWVNAEDAKSSDAIPVPLSAAAVSILRAQVGQHPEYAFTYRGKPVTQTSTKSWRAALARANISDFRWHDLRHTWASWHRQDGTPLDVLQDLGGWKSEKMVRIYAHLSADHLAHYVRRRETLESQGTQKGTVEKDTNVSI